jgi:glutathione S-transferase
MGFMSRPVLVIGNKNYSSWSFRAWLVLVKVGIDFEETRIPLDQPDTRKRLLEISPSGRVPVYVEGNLAIWDSLAIAEHIAESHPVLWPADRLRRARARSVSAEMHAGFGTLRTALPMNCRARGRHVRVASAVADDIRRIKAIWTDCRLASADRGPWLFGGFTIADAMFAPVVSRFLTYGIECRGIAGQYVEHVLADADVRRWFAGGSAEREVIAGEEVGVE